MSKLNIINAALIRAGREPIISTTEDREEVVLANTLYDDAVTKVLAHGAWTKATFRRELAGNGTPAYGFKYSYALPVDPKFIKLISTSMDSNKVPYAVEGTSILTDDTKCYIKYVGQLKESDEYGILIAECVEVVLAALLARSLTASGTFTEALKMEANRKLISNFAKDQTNNSARSYLDSSYIDVRK